MGVVQPPAAAAFATRQQHPPGLSPAPQSQVLKERNFPYSNIKLLASKRCVCKDTGHAGVRMGQQLLQTKSLHAAGLLARSRSLRVSSTPLRS